MERCHSRADGDCRSDVTTLTRFARAVAFAQLGDVPAAEREQVEFENARKTLGDDPGVFQNSPKEIAKVAVEILDGRIAEAKGDRTKAIRAYQRAVESEDALDYDEPPDWFYPARETLGAALMRAGQFGEAEKVFSEDLKRNPNNPRSLFGLAEAQRRLNKPSETAAARYKKYWHGAALRIEDL
ncbi:MAG TPA: tetratricopeptide repeat protein [Thermoanaerobaculia bacterium]|nr:tetratricopeptide repeat protein [Thermoanaerobaculia bacterium]